MRGRYLIQFTYPARRAAARESNVCIDTRARARARVHTYVTCHQLKIARDVRAALNVKAALKVTAE